jgi:endo-1,4-beta-xylanase
MTDAAFAERYPDIPLAEETLPDDAYVNETVDLPRPRLWHKIVAVGACALAFGLTACTSGGDEKANEDRGGGVVAEQAVMPEFDTSKGETLLKANWQYTPGVSQQDGGLHVGRTNLATMTTLPEEQKSAEPSYVANPPVSLYGPHVELEKKGSVGFGASLSNIQGGATISLLSGPHIRFDERVERQAGIDISVEGGIAGVTVWDGKSERPSRSEIRLEQTANSADIAVAQVDRQIAITINGQRLSPQPAVLGDQVWFGFNTTGQFDVNNFGVFPIKGTSQRVSVKDMSKFDFNVGPAENGLASIAAANGNGDTFIGTAVDLAELMANPEYTEFVLKNFNQIETETLAKFQALQPEEGKFEFAELDALVDFANRHGLTVHGHALVFGEAYPDWLHKKLEGATKQEALDIMRTHIQTVVTRYDGKHGHGKIEFWDVVNEPFDPDDWGELNTSNIWYRSIGKDYILQAFRAAREAFPEGKYGLNDWSIETDVDRRRAALRLLDDLPRGTVDFVGMQAHFDEDTLDDDEVMDGIYSGDLNDIFAQFEARGVKVRISEASVAENGDPEAQADVYRMLLEACVKSRNCIGFNIWGATSNRYYFTTTPEYGIGDDAPTKQDADDSEIVERPAMEALRRGAAA